MFLICCVLSKKRLRILMFMINIPFSDWYCIFQTISTMRGYGNLTRISIKNKVKKAFCDWIQIKEAQQWNSHLFSERVKKPRYEGYISILRYSALNIKTKKYNDSQFSRLSFSELWMEWTLFKAPVAASCLPKIWHLFNATSK